MKFPFLEAKARLIRIMGTFDLATGHADTFDELLDSLELELRDVLGHYREAFKRHTEYAGNGTAGRENMTAPTGYFFQMPKREWVGLTDEEIVGATCECVDDGTFNMNCAQDFAKTIEVILKEKNT
jgi:hypothetical protein